MRTHIEEHLRIPTILLGIGGSTLHLAEMKDFNLLLPRDVGQSADVAVRQSDF